MQHRIVALPHCIVPLQSNTMYFALLFSIPTVKGIDATTANLLTSLSTSCYIRLGSITREREKKGCKDRSRCSLSHQSNGFSNPLATSLTTLSHPFIYTFSSSHHVIVHTGISSSSFFAKLVSIKVNEYLDVNGKETWNYFKV